LDNKRYKYLIVWITILLIAGLLLHFRIFLFTNVIEPIALVFWTFWNVLSGIDQRLCWGGIIILCMIITFRLIPSSGDKLPRPAYNYAFRPPSKVDKWQGMIASGDHVLLRNELKNLLIDVLDQIGRYQAMESDEVKISYTLLPAETQEYLLNSETKRLTFQGSFWHSLKTLLSSMFLWRDKKITKRELDIISEIIQWMETELDISYE